MLKGEMALCYSREKRGLTATAVPCQAMSLSDKMEKGARLTPLASFEAENLV